MRNPKKASVLIVEAEPVTRSGLRQVINSHAALEVCAEAATLPAAREACARCRPAAVVLDVALGGGEGFALARELPRWNPALAVVAFTRLDDVVSVQRALRAGVLGYVTRLDPETALLGAIVQALAGQRQLGPQAAALLLETLARGRADLAGDDLATLTERERQVFTLIGRGLNTRAVAAELRLGVKTIETHRQRIREKLGLRDGAALQRRATLATTRPDPPTPIPPCPPTHNPLQSPP